MNKIFNKNKIESFLFIVTIIIVLFSSNAINYMYQAAFFEITDYFSIENEELNRFQRISFAGLAIGSIFLGQLTDCYGRKKILLYGLALLGLSSIVARTTSNFDLLITSCFFMGVAKAACIVTTTTLVLDKYSSSEKINDVLLTIRIFFLLLLVAAPFLSIWLVAAIKWQAAFGIIFVFSAISFCCAKYFVKETLPNDQKQTFSILKILSGYKDLFTNFNYISNALLYVYPWVILSIYTNSASIVLIESGALTIEVFSFYGSLMLIINMSFSFLSIYITNKKGLDFNKQLGFFVTLISSCLLFFYSSNTTMLFVALNGCTAGAAMMNGFFIHASMSAPRMKSLSVSLTTVLVNIVCARATFWTEVFFDDSMISTDYINLVISLAALTILFVSLYKKRKDLSKTDH